MTKKTKNQNKPEIRCVLCRAEVSIAVGNVSEGCPNCGTPVLPMDIMDDVELKINWHELKLLCLWSERWANHTDTNEEAFTGEKGKISSILFSIVGLLQEQFPSFDPLTMSGEVALADREKGTKTILPFIDKDGPAPPTQH